LFLDQAPNNPKLKFLFGDFECDPSDCCVLDDYAVVTQTNPGALADPTEVELVQNSNTGKHTL
jgi:hypothetical protein